MSIQDFLRKANQLITLKMVYKNTIKEPHSLLLDKDFTHLYDELLYTINKLSNKHLYDIKDEVIVDRLTSTIPLDDEYRNRKIVSKINNASNQVATHSKIGPANTLIVNGSMEFEVIDYVKLNPIKNNNLPKNEALVLRKVEDEQYSIVFEYYIENDITAYYNFIVNEDAIYKCFMKFKF